MWKQIVICNLKKFHNWFNSALSITTTETTALWCPFYWNKVGYTVLGKRRDNTIERYSWKYLHEQLQIKEAVWSQCWNNNNKNIDRYLYYKAICSLQDVIHIYIHFKVLYVIMRLSSHDLFWFFVWFLLRCVPQEQNCHESLVVLQFKE